MFSKVTIYLALDFGIILDKNNIQLTQEGAIVGTPNYMAPEAFSDTHEVDYRADIYSLGVILYRHVYGICPYEGENVYEIIENTVRKPDTEIYKAVRTMS